MSVNKILKKRQKQTQQSYETHESTTTQYTTNENKSQLYNNTQQNNHTPNNNKLSQHQQSLETHYQPYIAYSQSNPPTYQFSSTLLPNSASLQSRFRLPISLFIPPVSYQTQPQSRCIDTIPRCTICRAYMTYYNRIEKRGFTCFVCGRQNLLPSQYVVDAQNIELNQVSYHVLGGQNIYPQPLQQHSIVFLIDLNISSYESKLLYYMIAAMKQVLSRQQHDDTLIYFYTYDDVIHQYDFSGDEVTCIIIDSSINKIDGNSRTRGGICLSVIRQKLFNLLDQLQQICANNKKTSSNFLHAFSYVVESVKHTSAKLYIFQSNQAIAGQQFMNEYYKKPNSDNNDNPNKPKSIIDTKNKQFFTTFADPFLKLNMSFSMFMFSRNYKVLFDQQNKQNLRVITDLAKVSGSQLILYRKDTQQDLLKFYYDFSYLLGATYYDDVRTQFIISPGWYFTAVYANAYRLKQNITFKLCHCEQSKRLCITFLPQQSLFLPYCSIQVITNYIYNKQHFTTVNTSVLPLTSSLQKLYLSQNYPQISATLHKIAISGLRTDQINSHRNKTVKQLALIYKAANQFYKKRQKIPAQITSIMLSALGILKSSHFQLQSINDTIVLDTVISQRNFLQSCGINEIQNFFSPYLFNLSSMTQQMCVDDQQEFIYPQICQLKFGSVKEGMYLMDNGLALYLYVSKVCNPQLLKQLFGKQKFHKNETLTEQSLLTTTHFAQQVTNLIRICRQQKSYGWIPLYIVRWGQNSLNEKIFYMNFYAEKYDEFRTFKMTLNQFITLIGQQY